MAIRPKAVPAAVLVWRQLEQIILKEGLSNVRCADFAAIQTRGLDNRCHPTADFRMQLTAMGATEKANVDHLYLLDRFNQPRDERQKQITLLESGM